MRQNLIHIVSSNSWGGPQRYALDICSHFKSQGWRVRVVTRDAKNIDSRFQKAGIPIRHAPLREYPDIFSALIIKAMLKPILQGEGIIHTHSYHDAMTAIIARKLARRPDIKIITTRHKARRGKNSPLRRIVYSAIDRHIFVSEFSKSRFLSSWPQDNPPFPPDKMSVAYNSLLLPDNYKTIVEEPERGPVTAMYRGLLKPGKGVETLIDALSLLKDTHLRLRIVGSGEPDYADSIRRRALRRGVMNRIDWLRHADDAIPLIRESHFGVFPSVEPEAFGMTNMEFMACGRPQISTLTGGQKEFLTNGIDVIEALPADTHSLAEAMRRLTEDKELRSRLGTAAAHTYNEKLSWEIFIEKLTHIYCEDLNR